jgi:xylulokinase
MTSLIGLDVGTTSVKGIAVAPDGEVLAVAHADYPLSIPRPGWAEQDPEDWWRATQDVLEALGRDDAAGIGLSGQMHGLVALDASDAVIRPAILWNDGRTGAECEEIESTIGLDRLVALTGNRALPGFTAPKLLWLRHHEPESYARIAHVMLPKDYVRLRMCGERATDVADASGTLLLDVAHRTWSAEVLEALQLDRAWLPEVVESPTRTGDTSDGIPIAAGAGDQAAGALGVGVDRPGPLSVVLGTSGVVFAAQDAYGADPEGRVHAFCHAIPETWHAMGVMLSAAGALAWLRDVAAPGTGFETLVASAEGWEPGAEGLTFLPYLAGERTPHADPGGGARSDLWLRIVASVLELPLQRVAVQEGAAYGAALLGGVAGGVFADPAEAVAACVRPGAIIEPDPAWTGVYADGRERFRALYPALGAAAAAGVS